MKKNSSQTSQRSVSSHKKAPRKTHHRSHLGSLPMNDAAIQYQRELEQRNNDLIKIQQKIEREAKQRYTSALEESRLQRAEKKIVNELSRIQVLEHQMQLERVKTMRGKDVLSKTYMVEARYDDKQRALNQMLIDDKLSPRFSQPQPMKMPRMINSPATSDDDSEV